MFGNKISKEQQESSMNAADGMLLSIGAKGLKEWSVASDALILIMKTGMGQATKRNL
ncbi:hypothetical protein [Bacillus altitudinis]